MSGGLMQRPYGLARKREVPPHGRRKACKETNQSAMEEEDWFECFSCKASGNEHGKICSSRARDRAGSSIGAKSRARAFAFFRSSVKFVVAKRQFSIPRPPSMFTYWKEGHARPRCFPSEANLEFPRIDQSRCCKPSPFPRCPLLCLARGGDPNHIF